MKIEDDLNVYNKWRGHTKILQPKTIKSKSNGCGTAPGNLVNLLPGNFSDNACKQELVLIRSYFPGSCMLPQTQHHI